jgi:hypothetical protein
LVKNKNKKMKILKRNNEFKKMPDKNVGDVLAINNLLRQGWNYCARKVYKDFYKVEETVKPIKEKTDKQEKVETSKQEKRKNTKK